MLSTACVIALLALVLAASSVHTGQATDDGRRSRRERSESRSRVDILESEARLSRFIRRHSHESGAQWVSPRMLRKRARPVDFAWNQKPLMYLIVRTAPEDGPDLLTDLQLVGKTVLSSLTAQFHSVLVPDGYVAAVEPALSAPRHSYVPRAFFAQPNGTVRFDCINPAADRLTPYRYTSAEQLVAAMRTFLAAFREARGTARYPAGLDWDL